MSAACPACAAGIESDERESRESASQVKASQVKASQTKASQLKASDAGASHEGAGAAGARLAGRFLGLAATPVFALMALLAGLPGDGAMDAMCGHGPVLAGMLPMYLLMSAIHCGPWLALASSAHSSA